VGLPESVNTGKKKAADLVLDTTGAKAEPYRAFVVPVESFNTCVGVLVWVSGCVNYVCVCVYDVWLEGPGCVLHHKRSRARL
jgi:hypothetical protein